MPNKYLNEFFKITDTQILDLVADRLNILMDSLEPEGYYKLLLKMWNDDEDYAKKYFNDGEPARFTQLEAVLSVCRETANKQTRDVIFDIECGWSVRLRNGDAYLIPYGEHWTRNGLKLPEFAKDYSYWNNTDMPDDMTAGRWDRRGDRWDLVLKESPLLFHPVVDLKNDFVDFSVRIQEKLQLGFWHPDIHGKK